VRHPPEREVVEIQLVGRERSVHGDDTPALELDEVVLAGLPVAPKLALTLLSRH
jgi:hypothetical protein